MNKVCSTLMKVIIAIYIRVSTPRQKEEGYSLDAQIQNAKRKAEEMGLDAEFVVFCDSGVSASRVPMVNRKGLMDCLTYIRKEHPQYLFCWKRDRLARRTEEYLSIISTVLKSKTKIVYFGSSEPPLGSATGQEYFLETILAAFATLESQQTRMRILDTRKNLVLQGQWNISIPPYGFFFNHESQKYEHVEEEAQVVKNIFEIYVNQKLGALRITRLLNEKQIPTKNGGKWNKNYISRIIQNPFYVGKQRLSYIEINDNNEEERRYLEIDSNKITPIISQEQFDLAQSILGGRQNHKECPRNRATSYLLSGKIYCANCGSKFTTRTWSAKTKVSRTYGIYMCSSSDEGGTCYSRVKRDDIDNAVIEGIADELGKLDVNQILEQARVKMDKIGAEYDIVIDQLKKDLGRCKHKVEVIQNELEDNSLEQKERAYLKNRRGELLITIEQKEVQLTQAERDLHDFKNANMDCIYGYSQLLDWEHIFESASINEKRNMILDIVERVEYCADTGVANVILSLDDSLFSNRVLCNIDGCRCTNEHGLVTRTFSVKIA